MSAGGAIIMGLFAAVWWIAGTAVSGRGSLPVYAVGIALAGAIVGVAWRRPDSTAESDEERSRRGWLVGIASGAEGVLMLAAVNILANIGRRDLVAPAFAIIVGAHFLPLARWLPAPMYYVTSALLICLGLAGLRIEDPSMRVLTVSIGAACVLWLTCIAVLRLPSKIADATSKG